MILANTTTLAPMAQLLSWLSAALALLGYLIYAWRARRPLAVLGNPAMPDTQGMALLWLAWSLHGFLLLGDVLGWRSAQWGPHFGFGPVLSATAWLLILVHAIEGRGQIWLGVRRPLALLGAGAVVLVLFFSGEMRPHANSIWSPLHWTMSICAYALVAVAVVHALLTSQAEQAMRSNRKLPWLLGMPLLKLERLTFTFVQSGFVVLGLAIVLGAITATPWQWTHKSIFSLLSWLVLAILIWGRKRQGWRGVHASRWLYASAILLLLAYAGSRFVMEVLLERAV